MNLSERLSGIAATLKQMTQSVNLDSYYEYAEEDAERILNDVWGKANVPVDPYWIAEQYGIKVFEYHFNNDSMIAGAIAKEVDSDTVMYINQYASDVNKIYTCARLLGVYVLEEELFMDDVKENLVFEHMDFIHAEKSKRNDYFDRFARTLIK